MTNTQWLFIVGAAAVVYGAGWFFLVALALYPRPGRAGQSYARADHPPARRQGDRYTATADRVHLSAGDFNRKMAALFADRWITLLRTGAPAGHVFAAARLSASYAFRVDPSLKPQTDPSVPFISNVEPVVLQESQMVH